MNIKRLIKRLQQIKKDWIGPPISKKKLKNNPFFHTFTDIVTTTLVLMILFGLWAIYCEHRAHQEGLQYGIMDDQNRTPTVDPE